jgi:hypothetical protein
MKEPTPAEAWPGRRRLLNRLRMRQVALLLGLAEGRTLSAAAAEIGVSQPAATKLLRELESALGGVLFDRAGRQLRVNAAGRLVIAPARRRARWPWAASSRRCRTCCRRRCARCAPSCPG